MVTKMMVPKNAFAGTGMVIILKIATGTRKMIESVRYQDCVFHAGMKANLHWESCFRKILRECVKEKGYKADTDTK